MLNILTINFLRLYLTQINLYGINKFPTIFVVYEVNKVLLSSGYVNNIRCICSEHGSVKIKFKDIGEIY